MADAYTIEFEFRGKRYLDAEKGLKAFSDTLFKDWDGSARILSKELKDFLDQVAQALAKRHGGAWPGGTTSQTLSKRSGRLSQAIIDSVKVVGTHMDDVQGTIGAAVPYARIQETGGTIKAKGKLLCIPLPAALDSRGLPLKSSPRDWPNTFVAKSKAGNLLIFQKRGTTVIPLYVLRDQVKIPPRLGMRKTLDVGIPYFTERAMDQLVRTLIGGP